MSQPFENILCKEEYDEENNFLYCEKVCVKEEENDGETEITETISENIDASFQTVVTKLNDNDRNTKLIVGTANFIGSQSPQPLPQSAISINHLPQVENNVFRLSPTSDLQQPKCLFSNCKSKKHLPDKGDFCQECNKCVSYKNFLNYKKYFKNGDQVYKCKVCKKAYKFEKWYKKHQLTHQNNENKIHAIHSPLVGITSVPYQLSQFLSRPLEEQLSESCEPAFSEVYKRNLCGQCNKWFFNFQAHQKFTHRNIVHIASTDNLQINDGDFNNGEKFKCKDCDQSFATEELLIMHQIIQSDIKAYKCNKCEKTFKTQGHLKIHSKAHNNSEIFKCSKCDKSYKIKHHFEAHQNRHNEANTLNCTKCYKSFESEKLLKYHSQVHKAFKCTKCEKAYTFEQHLITHQKTHEIKLYMCLVCSRTFSFKYDLEVHKLSH